MERRQLLKSSLVSSVFPSLLRGDAEAKASYANTNSKTSDFLEIGLIADAQYADIPSKGTRYYRESIAKLLEAVQQLNVTPLQFCVHLGDLIDMHWSSFDAISEPIEKSKHRFYHVLGNHDFDVEDSYKVKVPTRIGMDQRYYAISQEGWKFLFLDTTDLSLYAQPKETPAYTVAETHLHESKKRGDPWAQPWNGEIGPSQLEWIEKECKTAMSQKTRVLIFSHHPVAPNNEHNVWNAPKLIEIVRKNPCIVAWINGHNHAGNLGEVHGVPFVTLQGMVETKATTAFSTLRLYGDRMKIVGYGREPSREFAFRTM